MPVQPPQPPLCDDVLRLAPLTAADVDEIDLVGDVDGFRELAMGAPISAAQIRHEVMLGVVGWAFKDVAAPRRASIRWGFAVRLADGRLVGMIAFEWFEVPSQRSRGRGRNGVSVSYWTAPDHRRCGYATHALSLTTPWAREAFGVNQIWLRPNNEGSVSVATKAGYVKTKVTLHGKPLFTSATARPS